MQRLVCVLEMLTSGPTSFCKTSTRRRVDTPYTYISAKASFMACSERMPRYRALG